MNYSPALFLLACLAGFEILVFGLLAYGLSH
jgi:hypothetical protein